MKCFLVKYIVNEVGYSTGFRPGDNYVRFNSISKNELYEKILRAAKNKEELGIYLFVPGRIGGVFYKQLEAVIERKKALISFNAEMFDYIYFKKSNEITDVFKEFRKYKLKKLLV